MTLKVVKCLLEKPLYHLYVQYTSFLYSPFAVQQCGQGGCSRSLRITCPKRPPISIRQSFSLASAVYNVMFLTDQVRTQIFQVVL